LEKRKKWGGIAIAITISGLVWFLVIKQTNKYHQKLPGNPSKMGANIPK
jgi:hypothetical protein